MKNIKNIVESKYAPSKLNIWLKGDRLYIYTAKGWIPIDTSFGDVRKKEYADYDTLRFDKPTDGTIGVDKSTGKFYIYSNVTGTWTALDDEIIEGTYIADEDTFYTVNSDEVINGEKGKLYIDYYSGNIYRWYNNEWLKITNATPANIKEVTWAELKSLRSNSELIPSWFYRITDYIYVDPKNSKYNNKQFDVIVLALEKNKLAEEGWAAMHENIYNVTFNDDVTKECYLYYSGRDYDPYNIVDSQTKLGIPDIDVADLIINEENKTVIVEAYSSTDLVTENVTYNDFQDVNFGEWKIWYCLDNDKSRFAWADIGGEIVQVAQLNLKVGNVNVVASRYTYGDFIKNDTQYYAWRYVDPTYGFNANCMTLTETPQPEDQIYINPYGTYTELDTNTTIINYIPPTLSQEGTGVIYQIQEGPAQSYTEVTYIELKNLRDNGALVPGALYRITDYQCTTTQENTRSAGHQFDIILLALSENKLAEEGWAMMNESNIYDVTFSDGVTKKCWIVDSPEFGNIYDNVTVVNVVDVETKLGLDTPTREEFIINEENKTATTEDWSTEELNKPNLTYNYFQKSNLSAWKVWYCLDNDTARFAWADDSIDYSVAEHIMATKSNVGISTAAEFVRTPDADKTISGLHYYVWRYTNPNTHYTTDLATTTAQPSPGDSSYNLVSGPTPAAYIDNLATIVSYSPAHEGTNLPVGKGVIYRLIDEWNNDCPYDFKNILYLRKLTDGGIDDVSGIDTYIPTFCLYDTESAIYKDASIFAAEYYDDVNQKSVCCNNKIGCELYRNMFSDLASYYCLNDIVIILEVTNNDLCWVSNNNHIDSSHELSLIDCSNVLILEAQTSKYITCRDLIVLHGIDDYVTNYSSGDIIRHSQRVVWENRS